MKKDNGNPGLYIKNGLSGHCPINYFIEGHSAYQSILSRLFEFNEKGGFSFVTSSVTLLEVLMKPLREDKQKLPNNTRTF